MKQFSAVVSATAIVAGLGGGAVAYQAVSSSTATVAVAKTTDPKPPAPQVKRPGVKFRFSPCKAPATRVGKACVIDVVQTVVVAAPAPAAPVRSEPRSDNGGPSHHQNPASHPGDDDPETTPAHDAGDDQGAEDEGDEGENHGEDDGNEPGDD